MLQKLTASEACASICQVSLVLFSGADPGFHVRGGGVYFVSIFHAVSNLENGCGNLFISIPHPIYISTFSLTPCCALKV